MAVARHYGLERRWPGALPGQIVEGKELTAHPLLITLLCSTLDRGHGADAPRVEKRLDIALWCIEAVELFAAVLTRINRLWSCLYRGFYKAKESDRP